MKVQITVVLILVLLHLTGVAYAVEEAQIVEISLDHGGGALVKNLFFTDSRNRTIFLLPVFSAGNINIFDEKNNLQYALEEGFLQINLGEQKDGYSFTAEYTSDFFTIKNSSVWTFSYLYTNLEDIENVKLTLVLPQNTQINSFTEGGVVYTDNGMLKIEWTLPPASQSFALDAEYSFSSSRPNPNTDNSLFPAIGLSSIIIIAIGALYLFYKQKMKKPLHISEKHTDKHEFSEGQKDIMKTLTVNERGIVNELFSAKEITQKKIGLKTGIPKATLSRTLKRLEAKTIIETRGYGTTRLVGLTKWFREK